MARIVAALLVLCAGSWSRSLLLLSDAQICVDESRLKEQVVYSGPQEPPYRLTCPLDPIPPQSSPQLRLLWQKNCQQLNASTGKTYVEFPHLGPEDEGNYTCLRQQGNSSASFTVRLVVKESLCSKAPEFQPNGSIVLVNVGAIVTLNCSALLPWDQSEAPCDIALRWSKEGHSLSNLTLYTQNTSSWSPAAGQLVVESLLVITVQQPEDFGLYSCTVRNVSSNFSLQDSGTPSHTAAVIAAIVFLLLLSVAAVVYCRCHLNIKLWYRNSYGDYELNDGKLYDAYVSYVNNDYDRKFVNFILKPHLENKNGYKLHLNNNNVLPGGEPSAELLMNMSRSRRLIVVLSYAYLDQDWCCANFRQGLLHLLEISKQPILIVLEGQSKSMMPEVKEQLREQQHCLTVLTWRHNSVTPSSAFWKELALAMPRQVQFHAEHTGDPQTMLQDDKDPMLTLEPDYLNTNSDIDPAGDLGLRLPVYKALAGKAPVLPAAPVATTQHKPSDIDVSDLGSRNYGARSDFYCLVSEDM